MMRAFLRRDDAREDDALKLHYRKDRGYWELRGEMETPAGVKRRQFRQRLAARTKKEAEVEAAKFITENIDTVSLDARTATVRDYLEKWLKTYAEPRVKSSTLQRYRELLRIHVEPHLGDVLLRKLRPLDIEDCYAQVRLTRSLKTTLNVHRVFREALQQGVRWRMLSWNPADSVEAPRPPKASLKIPTLPELTRLLAAGDETPYGPIYRLAIYTGLRQGELLALRWQEVDLERAQLTVTGSARRLRGEGVVRVTPKTEASVRPMDLGPLAVVLLREQRRRQAEVKMQQRRDYHDDGFVFSDPLGRPLDGIWISRVWRKLAEAADLKGVRFHDLRHANASLMLRGGVPMKVAQTRLGHATMSTTADIYSHVAPADAASAAAVIEALLSAEEKRGPDVAQKG